MNSILTTVAGFLVGILFGYLIFSSPAEAPALSDSPERSSAEPVFRFLTESETSSTEEDVNSDFNRQLTLYQQASGLGWQAVLEKFESLAWDTRQPRRNAHEYDLSRIYLQRLMEIDPQQTLSLLVDKDQMHYFYSTFCRYAQRDLEGALQFSSQRQQQFTERGVNVLRCLVDAADQDELENNPVLMALAETAGPEFEQILAARRIQSLPPAEAFSQAMNLRGQQRQQMLQEAGRRWAAVDLNGFLEAVKAIPSGNERLNLLMNSVGQALIDDPLGALRALEGLAMPRMMDHQIQSAMRGKSFEEGRALYEAYLSSGEGTPFAGALAAGLMQIDAEAALAYYSTLSQQEKQEIYTRISFHRATVKPRQMLDWVLGEGGSYAQAATMSMQAIARQDPQLVLDRFDEIRAHENAAQLIQGAVGGISSTDPRLAMQVVEEFWDEPGYANAVHGALASWASYDPFEAGEYVAENLADGDFRSPMTAHLINRMMSADQARARNYVEGLPEGAFKQQAHAGLAIGAALTDRDEAVSMWRQLTDESIRHQTAMHMAQLWLSQNPRDVDAVANQLGLDTEALRAMVAPAGTSSVISFGVRGG